MNEKSPVKLRKRLLKNGVYSLYLDIYQDGKRQVESLKLYLNPGNDSVTKAANKAALQAANVIYAKRLVELQENKAGIVRTSNKNMTMTELFDTYIKSRINSRKNYINSILNAKASWINFAGQNFRLKNVDENVLLDYIRFLKKCIAKRRKTTLNPSTVNCYFSVLSVILKYAVNKGYILNNPMEKMEKNDKPKTNNKLREYLTIEELRILNDTYCSNPTVKNAFLFACYTGLRKSDIRQVTWEMIDKRHIRLNMVKTGDEINIPLTKKALSFVKEPRIDEFVFHLGSDNSLRLCLNKWLKASGIAKNITFHSSRHTFATLLISSGTDIYTVSKMLGHRDVSTTTIYAKLIDAKKKEAIDKLPEL